MRDRREGGYVEWLGVATVHLVARAQHPPVHVLLRGQLHTVTLTVCADCWRAAAPRPHAVLVFKLYALLSIVSIILMVWCLIEAVSTDESRIRNLPKLWWILLILFFPLAGSIAWLVAGRPVVTGPRPRGPRRRSRSTTARVVPPRGTR